MLIVVSDTRWRLDLTEQLDFLLDGDDLGIQGRILRDTIDLWLKKEVINGPRDDQERDKCHDFGQLSTIAVACHATFLQIGVDY